jgi:manganese/zinc/iron transport system ATP- binding protein
MITLPYRREPCHGQSVPGEAAVQVTDVSVAMPGDDRLALDGVDLTVPIGSRTALVGPNGAGKSTLLKAIVGILKSRSGSIRVYGMPVASCLHRVAYLPQRGEIDWTFPMTVRELVLTGRYVHLGWLRRPGAEDRALVEREIRRLRLDDLADRQIGQLSGGQQQRTLLARALVQGADLLLLDEPMNAVDVETRMILTGVLDDLRAEGKTAIIATHDIGRLESDFDDVLFLVDGHQVTAEEAFAREHLHAAPANEMRAL